MNLEGKGGCIIGTDDDDADVAVASFAVSGDESRLDIVRYRSRYGGKLIRRRFLRRRAESSPPTPFSSYNCCCCI